MSPATDRSPTSLSTLALRHLRLHLRFWNDLAASQWQPSKETLDLEQREIERLWAWTRIIDVSRKTAYRNWLQFAQYGLHKARTEMLQQRLTQACEPARPLSLEQMLDLVGTANARVERMIAEA